MASAAKKLAETEGGPHRAVPGAFAASEPSLPSLSDPLAERRRALRIGKDILGLLEALHSSLRASSTAETIAPADLAAIEPAVASLRNVLGEIQLRAQSELDKLDQAPLQLAANDRRM